MDQGWVGLGPVTMGDAGEGDLWDASLHVALERQLQRFVGG